MRINKAHKLERLLSFNLCTRPIRCKTNRVYLNYIIINIVYSILFLHLASTTWDAYISTSNVKKHKHRKPELVVLLYIANGNISKLSKRCENAENQTRTNFFKKYFLLFNNFFSTRQENTASCAWNNNLKKQWFLTWGKV